MNSAYLYSEILLSNKKGKNYTDYIQQHSESQKQHWGKKSLHKDYTCRNFREGKTNLQWKQ